MDGIFWPGVASICAMYVLVFFVGVWASRRAPAAGGDSLDEMMLAGRSLPLWLGLFTMTATWVGGGYINGTAEATFGMGLTWGLQAPIGYSLSLVLGGLFFARMMRRNRYATLIDPFEVRFGRLASLLLLLSAVLSEIIWSAAILVALGSTFATVVGLDLTTSIVISAAVAVGYTITGGMWSVAYTDVVQLVMIVIGLLICIPFAITAAGGLEPVTAAAVTESGVIGFAGWHEAVSYADWLLLLMLGGIPWNIYFQRVLATQDERSAVRLSIGGGLCCMLMAIPALILGLSARATDWTALGGPETAATLAAMPSQVLPLLFKVGVPGWVGIVGLGAVAAAVMASTDSSILSATSMAAWNGWRRLVRPQASPREMVWVMRVIMILVGAIATWIALVVPSVTALWYLCGDVVYVLLFPALALAMFDKQANGVGVLAGMLVAAFLRLGGGEPTLGIPAFLPYPEWADGGMVAFPFRTLAMVSGLGAAVVVSRLSAVFDAPRPLAPAAAVAADGRASG